MNLTNINFIHEITKSLPRKNNLKNKYFFYEIKKYNLRGGFY